MVGETLWFATSGTSGVLSDVAGSLLGDCDSPPSLGSAGAAQATAESVIATQPRNIDIFIMIETSREPSGSVRSSGAGGVPTLIHAIFRPRRGLLRRAARPLLSAARPLLTRSDPPISSDR